MGRKTYQSIGRPLPGRETVVVTRDRAFLAREEQHLHVAHDFEEALVLDRIGGSMHTAEMVLAGGGYRLGLPRATFLRLTRVDSEPQADAFFPDVDWSQWKELRRETPERGPKDEVGLENVDYKRV